MTPKNDSEIMAFASSDEWERWLAKAHGDSPGIWLRLFKKSSSVESVTHAEALVIALCFGWIDGQIKKLDQESWLRKFMPRRPRSIWSKRIERSSSNSRKPEK